MTGHEWPSDPLMQAGRLFSHTPVSTDAVELVRTGETTAFWNTVIAAATERGAAEVIRAKEQKYDWVVRPDAAFVDTTSSVTTLTDPETGFRVAWRVNELASYRHQPDTDQELADTYSFVPPESERSRRIMLAQVNVTPEVPSGNVLYVRFDSATPLPSTINRSLDAPRWSSLSTTDIPIMFFRGSPGESAQGAFRDYPGRAGMERLFSVIYRSAGAA